MRHTNQMVMSQLTETDSQVLIWARPAPSHEAVQVKWQAGWIAAVPKVASRNTHVAYLGSLTSLRTPIRPPTYGQGVP